MIGLKKKRSTQTVYIGMESNGEVSVEIVRYGGRHTLKDEIRQLEHMCDHCNNEAHTGEFIVELTQLTIFGIPIWPKSIESVTATCNICWRELHPEFSDEWVGGTYGLSRDGYKWNDHNGPHISDEPTHTGGWTNAEARREVRNE